MRHQLVLTPQHLGRAIRDARAPKGLTQAQAAVLCGISQPTLSKIERGVSSARLGTILAILAVLGLELHVERRSLEKPSMPWED